MVTVTKKSGARRGMTPQRQPNYFYFDSNAVRFITQSRWKGPAGFFGKATNAPYDPYHKVAKRHADAKACRSRVMAKPA